MQGILLCTTALLLAVATTIGPLPLAGALVAVAAYAFVVVALLVAVRQTALPDGGSRCSSLRRSAARWLRSASTSSSA